MKKMKLEEAIGKPLANDMTRIIPGKVKGAAFKRGHILREEDIPMLRDMGKAHVYVLDPDKGYIHEDDAAIALSRAYGKAEDFERQGPAEGRINLKARFQGILKINLPLLTAINETGDVICSTLHQHTVCVEGTTAAATRIIPVAMDAIRFNKTLEIVKRGGPLLRLLPFVRKKIGVIVTGEEVFSGRIPDSSRDILSPKIAALGGRLTDHAVCPDDAAIIGKTIAKMVEEGCEIVITTGGLSVDPDDVTLEGIRKSGAELVSYGSPILPGAMFACATLKGMPVLGIPAAIFYFKATVLDIFLPRAMADDPITREDIVALGHGGLCLNCRVCTYPVCPFGKGA